MFSRTLLRLKFVSVSLLSLMLSPLRLPPISPLPRVVEPPPQVHRHHSLRSDRVHNDFTVCTNTDSIAAYIPTPLTRGYAPRCGMLACRTATYNITQPWTRRWRNGNKNASRRMDVCNIVTCRILSPGAIIYAECAAGRFSISLETAIV